MSNNAGKDGIDLWIFKEGGTKKSAWIPYLLSMEKATKKPPRWRVVFNGGELTLELRSFVTIMFYGRSGNLPAEFLIDASAAGTTVILHSRNTKSPLVLVPAVRAGAKDILEAQILMRSNSRKRSVVAKAFVEARAYQTRWLIPTPDAFFAKLRGAESLEEIRSLEASHATRYWDAYFNRASQPGWTRREPNPISEALDALSSFLSGRMLRWVYLHRMSPHHGFLHESTEYQSLIYDLMEPTRHWMEHATLDEYINHGEEGLTARATMRLKDMLDEWVEVPNLQVSATRRNIMHGHVLALRSYLVGDMKRMNLPKDSLVREVKRPLKVTYKIPGSKKRER